jgi:hypothetical protein
MSKKPPNAPKGVDPDAMATDEERAGADVLRRALEDPACAHDDAALASRLRAAWSPPPIDPEAHRRILAAALAHADPAPARRPRIMQVVFATATTMALAAGVAAVLSTRGNVPASAEAPAAGAVSRSTQPLFADRFPSYGGQTSRVDRIALARATDLRDNEFSRWGVR